MEVRGGAITAICFWYQAPGLKLGGPSCSVFLAFEEVGQRSDYNEPALLTHDLRTKFLSL